MIRELVEPEREHFKTAKVWFKVKWTNDKHTEMIRFLTRPAIEKVNMEWYENELMRFRNIQEGNAELRKLIILKKI